MREKRINGDSCLSTDYLRAAHSTAMRAAPSHPTFKDKRSFMEREFTRQNNKAFGYERFEYLYLEDSFPEAERIRLTHEKICAFFKEK